MVTAKGMRHNWNKEERKIADGRPYYVTVCTNCGRVKEKAWTGYLYYPAGYDPAKDFNATFDYSAGKCETKTHAG